MVNIRAFTWLLFYILIFREHKGIRAEAVLNWIRQLFTMGFNILEYIGKQKSWQANRTKLASAAGGASQWETRFLPGRSNCCSNSSPLSIKAVPLNRRTCLGQASQAIKGTKGRVRTQFRGVKQSHPLTANLPTETPIWWMSTSERNSKEKGKLWNIWHGLIDFTKWQPFHPYFVLSCTVRIN